MSVADQASVARESILGRVRSASAAPQPLENASDRVPRPYRRSGRLGPSERLELFAARCREYGAEVRIAPDGAVGETIAASLARAGLKRVAVATGLPVDWRPGSATWVEDGLDPPADLDCVDAALTGCAVAIAETGTVVLDGGPAQGRRALTLVPDYHLCVVRAGQVVELLPEALDRLRPSAEAGRPITFVSGCSATSDIELERVSGVHGPRTLELLLVDAENARGPQTGHGSSSRSLTSLSSAGPQKTRR